MTQYEQFALAQQREMIRANVEQAERQHYQLIINKLANAGNPNTDTERDFDKPLALQEAGLTRLRDELRRVDEMIAHRAAEARAAAEVPAAQEPPAPGEVATAVHGGAVSEPENDAPAP